MVLVMRSWERHFPEMMRFTGRFSAADSQIISLKICESAAKNQPNFNLQNSLLNMQCFLLPTVDKYLPFSFGKALYFRYICPLLKNS